QSQMPCLREAGGRSGKEEQWHPTSKTGTSCTGACARRRHPHSCLVWTTPTEPLRSGRTKPHQRHPSGRGGGALAANPQRVAALRAASPALRRPLFFFSTAPVLPVGCAASRLASRTPCKKLSRRPPAVAPSPPIAQPRTTARAEGQRKHAATTVLWRGSSGGSTVTATGGGRKWAPTTPTPTRQQEKTREERRARRRATAESRPPTPRADQQVHINAARHRLVTVDAPSRQPAAEEVADQLPHLRHAQRPANQHNLVYIVLVQFSALQHALHRHQRPLEQLHAQPLKPRACDLLAKVEALRQAAHTSTRASGCDDNFRLGA
ncbi:uncharacterized protein Tco025E_09207, partial [Trypanosoma conorhini]